MFLDADEIFDADLSDMTAFFKDSEALRKYNSATHMVRNYLDPEGKTWSVHVLSRIVKNLPSVRFQGAIHEHLNPFLQPTRNLKSFSHHWGYVHETEEQREAKRQRNLVPLYEELKKSPRDLRIRSHILADLLGDEFTEFLAETLREAKKQPNHDYAQGLFAMNISNAYMSKQYEKALGNIGEFIKVYSKKPKGMRWLDIYAAKALSLSNLERHEEAVEAFDEYFKLYDIYLAGKLPSQALGNLVITFSEPHKRDELKLAYDNLLVKTGRSALVFTDNMTIKVEVSENAVKTESDSVEEKDWKPILEAIQNSSDITGIAANTDRELLGKYMAKISQQVLNLPNLALSFNPGTRDTLFDAVLYETASKQAGRLPWHERAALYKNFVEFAAKLAEDYNPDDELHRFGRYAGEGKYKEALEVLQSEHLKWAVEFLIEDSEESVP
jgi:tetratricopeptide (TPR) repeat protein